MDVGCIHFENRGCGLKDLTINALPSSQKELFIFSWSKFLGVGSLRRFRGNNIRNRTLRKQKTYSLGMSLREHCRVVSEPCIRTGPLSFPLEVQFCAVHATRGNGMKARKIYPAKITPASFVHTTVLVWNSQPPRKTKGIPEATTGQAWSAQ